MADRLGFGTALAEVAAGPRVWAWRWKRTGQRLASGCGDGGERLENFESGRRAAEAKVGNGKTRSVALWPVRDGEEERRLPLRESVARRPGWLDLSRSVAGRALGMPGGSVGGSHMPV